MKTSFSQNYYDYLGEKINIKKVAKEFGLKPNVNIWDCYTCHLENDFPSYKELQKFLSKCKYVSDQEQFGLEEHWMRPDEFEKTCKGDCEDFSLFTWRHLLKFGEDSRFVVGLSGRKKQGHAWCTSKLDGKYYIIEPQKAAEPIFMKTSVLNHQPIVSFGIIDNKLVAFKHKQRPPLKDTLFKVVHYSKLSALLVAALVSVIILLVPLIIIVFVQLRKQKKAQLKG